MVQVACLSTIYQVEQWYGTGPQDHRIKAKEHQGSIPALSTLFKQKRVNEREKGSVFCLHLKHYIEL